MTSYGMVKKIESRKSQGVKWLQIIIIIMQRWKSLFNTSIINAVDLFAWKYLMIDFAFIFEIIKFTACLTYTTFMQTYIIMIK